MSNVRKREESPVAGSEQGEGGDGIRNDGQVCFPQSGTIWRELDGQHRFGEAVRVGGYLEIRLFLQQIIEEWSQERDGSIGKRCDG